MTGVRFDRRLGVLVAASFLVLFVAIVAAVVLPLSDEAIRAAPRALDATERAGMRVYRSQGCWYCHTQQVRPVMTDAGLGGASKAGDYALDERPAMLGSERVGPDLAHVGARIRSKDELLRLLRDPRARDRHSSMPSYAQLSERDLGALAAYLLSLR